MYISIKNDKGYYDIFYHNSISIQTTIGSHGTINLSFDLSKYPNYSDYFNDFFHKFEKNKSGLFTPDFTFLGWHLTNKSISSKSIMEIEINFDYFIRESLQDRRDNILNYILNQTSDNKNDII
jgi:hypothetical protein